MTATLFSYGAFQMTVYFDPGRYAASALFYCARCTVWHIDSDSDPAAQCYYCDRPLCPQYNYACIGCGRLVCNHELQAC